MKVEAEAHLEKKREWTQNLSKHKKVNYRIPII